MNALLILLIRLIVQLLTSAIRMAFMLAFFLGRLLGLLLPALVWLVIALARWLIRMGARSRSNDVSWLSREPRGSNVVVRGKPSHRPRTKRPMIVFRRMRRVEDLKRRGR